MNRTLLFIACVLASFTMSAQEELAVEDIQDSGCMAEARAEEYVEPVPTIVLTKEGSVLSVQLLNYESNCFTAGFIVKPTVSGGSDGKSFSVNISVAPYLPGDEIATCVCPYNVSFTVRGLEANSFYLSCWWYVGQVTLEEGKPLVLEDIWEEADINGMKYTLRKAMDRALLVDGSTQKGEVRIPSKIGHEGNTYTVTGISYSAFKNNEDLTKVVIPKTIKNMDLSDNIGIDSNPFSGCTALQSIEVEAGNPAVCSLDGVLFNKEKTKLLSYPAGAQQTSYTVPEGVTRVEGLAFSYSQHLRKVILTDNVTALGNGAFYESKSLEEVRLPSGLKTLENYLFWNCLRLKSVTIPQNVTHLGLKAFQNCTSLTSVTMPESVTSTDYSVFDGCKSLKSVTLSPKLGRIEYCMFSNCSSLKELIIPDGVNMVGSKAFNNCSALASLDLPESVNRLGDMVFAGCKLKSLYIRGIIDSKWMSSNIFRDMDTNTNLYVKPSEVEKYKAIYKGPVYPLPEQTFDEEPYRPFVEEGKMWKVGALSWGNPVQWVEYFYFDGDTIIGGKSCKQMMCQRFISPDFPNFVFYSQQPSLNYVGAWYEENKKVFFCNATNNQFNLMYDFSIEANDTLEIDNKLYVYVIGPRQTGGIKGFKGVYRQVWECQDGENTFRCAPWLEGVGIVWGPPTSNVFNIVLGDPAWFLISCAVGDEVIYFLDGIEDGATPEEARKRFDFTHTIKTKPQAPRRAMGTRSSSSTEVEPILYGEYNNQQLGINLDPLADAYVVHITNDTGKTVYEKTVNAGSIVGLNIDISTYAAGRYTVVVENSQESFTGEFETLTAGIEEKSLTPALSQGEEVIYNLQGQRISSLQKGLNIVNGQKVYVK